VAGNHAGHGTRDERKIMKLILPVKAKCVDRHGHKWEEPVTLAPGNTGELVVSWPGAVGWYVSSFCNLDGYSLAAGSAGFVDGIAMDCGAGTYCENRVEIIRHISATLAKQKCWSGETRKLVEFARHTLDTLTAEPEWSADTMDEIANYALTSGLAKLGSGGMFTAEKEGA